MVFTLCQHHQQQLQCKGHFAFNKNSSLKFQKFHMPSGIRVNGKHSGFYHTRANFGQTIPNDWLLLVAVEEKNVLQSIHLLITWQQVWNKKQMDSLVNSNTELGQVNITWHSADSNLIQILHNTHKPQDMFLCEWLPDVFSHFWYGTAQKVFG